MDTHRFYKNRLMSSKVETDPKQSMSITGSSLFSILLFFLSLPGGSRRPIESRFGWYREQMFVSLPSQYIIQFLQFSIGTLIIACVAYNVLHIYQFYVNARARVRVYNIKYRFLYGAGLSSQGPGANLTADVT